jgi:hypothetical protein
MNRKLLLTSAATVCCAAMALGVPAASAATVATSENWAGYEATNGTSNFSAVSGSWVQPTATCTSQSPTYSAFWVGLGGGGQSSSALEQIGTQSDCTAAGATEYYAWYELVPKAPVRLDMTVGPGDRMYARVTVSGTTVHLSLENQTTGASVDRTLQMSNPDTSTAEWVAEAPSQCMTGLQDCTPLPLTDFGSVRFSNAYATSNGHTGSIGDSSWSTQAIALAPSDGSSYAGYGGYGASGNTAGAQPSSLSSGGSEFSVSYSASGDSSAQNTASDGEGGYGYGAGYGYGGTYSYGEGYGYGGYGYGPGAFMPY